jgi:hypothetical protein
MSANAFQSDRQNELLGHVVALVSDLLAGRPPSDQRLFSTVALLADAIRAADTDTLALAFELLRGLREEARGTNLGDQWNDRLWTAEVMAWIAHQPVPAQMHR